jgi:hypothetical protein
MGVMQHLAMFVFRPDASAKMTKMQTMALACLRWVGACKEDDVVGIEAALELHSF